MDVVLSVQKTHEYKLTREQLVRALQWAGLDIPDDAVIVVELQAEILEGLDELFQTLVDQVPANDLAVLAETKANLLGDVTVGSRTITNTALAANTGLCVRYSTTDNSSKKLVKRVRRKEEAEDPAPPAVAGAAGTPAVKS